MATVTRMSVMPCMPEINNETTLKNPQLQQCFPTNMQRQTRSAGCLLSVTWRLITYQWRKPLKEKQAWKPLMYGVYHVDVERCMLDKPEFRNQVQGAHEAPFHGPQRIQL